MRKKILGGDFNLVLDFKEDKKGGLPRTYQNASKIINQNCEERNSTDIWRTLNADINTDIHGAGRSRKFNNKLRFNGSRSRYFR